MRPNLALSRREKINRNKMVEMVAQRIINAWQSDDTGPFIYQMTSQELGVAKHRSFNGILQQKINSIDNRYKADVALVDAQVRIKLKTETRR